MKKFTVLLTTTLLFSLMATAEEIKFRCDKLSNGKTSAFFTRIDITFDTNLRGEQTGYLSSMERMTLDPADLGYPRAWENFERGNHSALPLFVTDYQNLEKHPNLDVSINSEVYRLASNKTPLKFLVPVDRSESPRWRAKDPQPVFYMTMAEYKNRANISKVYLNRIISSSHGNVNGIIADRLLCNRIKTIPKT